MKINRHESNSDTHTLPQRDLVCADQLERGKDQAFLSRIQGVVNPLWNAFSGRG